MANDLYITEIHQYAFGVEMVTTINHFSPDEASPFRSDQINEHVCDVVLPAINDLQGAFVSNDKVYTYYASGLPNAFLRYPGGGGSRAAAPSVVEPLFLTASVRWQVDEVEQYGPRLTPVQTGYTRISGLLDEDVVNGQISEDMQTLLISTFAPAWITSISIGPDLFWTAIHVNKTKTATGWKVAKNLGYMYSKLGTQNTRKR